MSGLPVRKIPGIGNVTEQLLDGLDVKLCSDILNKKYELRAVFTDNSFDFFIQSALGLGSVHHGI